MKNYEILENLCSKLTEWGIDPPTLLKAIGIFLVIIISIALFVIFPKVFLVLLITAICVAVIALIYAILEDFD